MGATNRATGATNSITQPMQGSTIGTWRVRTLYAFLLKKILFHLPLPFSLFFSYYFLSLSLSLSPPSFLIFYRYIYPFLERLAFPSITLSLSHIIYTLLFLSFLLLILTLPLFVSLSFSFSLFLFISINLYILYFPSLFFSIFFSPLFLKLSFSISSSSPFLSFLLSYFLSLPLSFVFFSYRLIFPIFTFLVSFTLLPFKKILFLFHLPLPFSLCFFLLSLSFPFKFSLYRFSHHPFYKDFIIFFLFSLPFLILFISSSFSLLPPPPTFTLL
ncbi:HSP90A [Acanthosepion pharaonis]|uniref:HSP90A n=1 Tax=Acanthosepion pharaonis TaxID=158019 RepID=A0A812AYW8_ACAPH|nr:HSP90A [Sepia pharaonis]